MNDELQTQEKTHTENAVMMLQVILQKLTAEIIHSHQNRPEYYDTMCRTASDLAYWIRNLEQNFDVVETE